jgi:tetratricopeptide (TPR) repeat protein
MVAAGDAWAARWATSYRGVCEAAWSPALHDRGMECLSRGAHVLDTTIDVVVEPGIDPAKLASAVSHLPEPEACGDAGYLSAIVPPPTDPALAKIAAAADGELERVKALQHIGKLEQADALLKTIEARAPIDYPPLAAHVHFQRAMHLRWTDDPHAVTVIRDAYFEARAAGDRVLAAEAADEASMALLDASQDAEAGEWARLAEVEVAPIPDPALQAESLRTLSVIATARGDTARGVALAERSMQAVRKLPFYRPLGLEVRGEAYDADGKYGLALADLDEAARLQRATFGEIYPELATLEITRSLVLMHLGRGDDAIAAARSALEIAKTVYDPGTPSVVHAVGALGSALTYGREFPEALEMLDRSLALTTKLEGPHSYNVASDLNNRCILLTQMLRYDDAIADGKLAAQVFSESAGSDAGEVAIADANVADALLGARRFAEAHAAAEVAVAAAQKHPDVATLGTTLTARATASRELGNYPDARKDLDAAIVQLTKVGGDPTWLASAQLELAYVERHDGHRDAARTLAGTARDALQAHHDHREAEAVALVASFGAAR